VASYIGLASSRQRLTVVRRSHLEDPNAANVQARSGRPHADLARLRCDVDAITPSRQCLRAHHLDLHVRAAQGSRGDRRCAGQKRQPECNRVAGRLDAGCRDGTHLDQRCVSCPAVVLDLGSSSPRRAGRNGPDGWDAATSRAHGARRVPDGRPTGVPSTGAGFFYVVAVGGPAVTASPSAHG
jgi:hypothetical protein